MNYLIQPIPSFPAPIVQFNLFDFRTTPNQTLNAHAQLITSAGTVAFDDRVVSTSGQYQAWGTNVDDNAYWSACFAANLGLTITGTLPVGLLGG